MLPDWTPAFILILLAIGFPLSLIFSWIFDVTTKGIEKTPSVESIQGKISTDNQEISKQGRMWGKVINWALLGIFIFIIAAYIIIKRNNHSEDLSVYKFALSATEGTSLVDDSFGTGSSVAVSPDGTKLVYAVYSEGTSYLYLRNMDDFEAQRIKGTEDAVGPFFSADGRWLGFFTNNELKKVAINGGTPQVICETMGYGGTWGPENRIIFTDYNKYCLMQVSSNGGKPEQLTSSLKFSVEAPEQWHLWPQILPGGEAILYTATINRENQKIVARTLKNGNTKTIIEPGKHAIYSPDGYLIYSWQGNLFAVRFDPDKLEVLSESHLIFQNVQMHAYGSGHYSLSEEGTLVYVPGDLLKTVLELVQADQKGDTTSMGFSVYQSPRYSPDGNQLLGKRISGEDTFWIYGLERGTYRRITEEGFLSYWAIWSPDGRYVYYNSNRGGTQAVSLFRKRSDGTGQAELVYASEHHQLPKCWSADGRYLIYLEGIHSETGMDIFMLEVDGDSIPVPMLNSRYNEFHPLLSPDGKWLAYVSDESGREEVFVRSFPELEEKRQISTNGGLEPLWAPDGKTLYYRDAAGNQIFSTEFSVNPEVKIGKPQLMFVGDYKGSTGPWGRNYDISPDGQYFLLIAEKETPSNITQMNVVLHCFEEIDPGEDK
jgi:serine/threonine-protein kinase